MAGRLFNFMMVLFALTILTLITFYCAAGRIVLKQLPEYRIDLEQALSASLAMPVTFAAIEGHWVGFDPVFSLRGMTVNSVRSADGLAVNSASLAQLRVRFSFLSSLFSQKLDIQSLEIDQLQIALQQTDSGDWLFGQLNLVDLLVRHKTDAASDGQSSLIQKWLNLDDLTVIVSRSVFRLTDKHGVARNWQAPVVHLDYAGDDIAASGQILEPHSTVPMFSFALNGGTELKDEPASEDHFQSTLYIELNSGTLLDELLKTYEWRGFSTRDIDADGRLWLGFEDFSLRWMQGDLQLNKLDWVRQQVVQTPLQNLDLNFSYQAPKPVSQKTDQHTLSLTGLHLGAPQTDCIPSQLVLTQGMDTLSIAVDQLDIACALGLADLLGVLDDELKQRFDISQPQGLLHNVQAVLPQGEVARSSAPAFSLQAELSNVSLQPYESTPGGTGIDGYVEAIPGSGRIIFESDRFTLFFPKLYHKPFLMSHAEGQVGWYENGDEVVVSSQGLRLYLENDSAEMDSLVYGDFIARLNPDDQEDVLALQIGVQDVPFTDVIDYVPFTVNPGVYKWLGQSMSGGMVQNGIYVGYGNIESNSPDNSFTSSLQMHTREGELKFQPNWPTLTSLDVTVELQNNALWVSSVERADLLGHPVENLNVVLDPDYARQHNKGVSVLDVQLKTRVINQQLHYWLAESPVSENTRTLADQLKLEGEVAGEVTLQIPMEGDDPVRYDIVMSLASETLRHLPSALTLSNIKGQIRLNHEHGLTAQDLQARLFDQTATLAIESVVGTASTAAQTKITLRSHLDMQRWFEHYQLPQVRGISGGFDFVAMLDLHETREPHLLVYSDLVGLVRDWPEPLTKHSEIAEKLSVDLLLQPNQTQVMTDWLMHNNMPLKSTLTFAANRFSTGELLLGEAKSYPEQKNGLWLRAEIEQLELAPWVAFWSSDEAFLTYPVDTALQFDSEEPPSSEPLLRGIEIKAGSLNVYDERLVDVSATLIPPATNTDSSEVQAESWRMHLNGPSVAGEVRFAYQDSPLALDLSYLNLVRPEDPEVDESADIADADGQPHVALETAKTAEQMLAEEAAKKAEEELLEQKRRDTSPANIPPMRVAIGALKLGSEDYGSWRSNLEPIADGILFKSIDGEFHGARIKGLLEWKKTGSSRHTSMALLNVSGSDMATLLTFFDVNDLVTSAKYTSDLTLNWSDMPSQFELARLSGTANLDMKNGLLKTDDTKTGFLRVFGALNPATVFRRLKLDFDDLVSSGVAYDTLNVRAGMNQGQLSLQEPLLISGPSSNYDITGDINMDTKTLNLNMVMTLPLTENVPLAALALGAPVVGGAVWIVDKLLGQPLSALTTAGYSVTGPWSEPIIELREVVTAGERRVLKPSH